MILQVLIAMIAGWINRYQQLGRPRVSDEIEQHREATQDAD